MSGRAAAVAAGDHDDDDVQAEGGRPHPVNGASSEQSQAKKKKRRRAKKNRRRKKRVSKEEEEEEKQKEREEEEAEGGGEEEVEEENVAKGEKKKSTKAERKKQKKKAKKQKKKKKKKQTHPHHQHHRHCHHCCKRFGVLLALVVVFFAWQWLGSKISIEHVSPLVANYIPQNLQEGIGRLNRGVREHFPFIDNSNRPGTVAAARGWRAHYPVLMVPGIVSTGLEIWQGKECASIAKNFRERLWGTVTMMQQLLIDRKCWLEHMMLNRTTGLDPEGIKLRAALGLGAADYLFPGYWVWGKLIENLADIGYDPNNLFMAGYDWRLSYHSLEVRDRFFTKLKLQIEHIKETNNGKKVVVMAHSMGTNVFFYFMKWVEAPYHTKEASSGQQWASGGGGGPSWVNDHIHTFVNLAGPLLGVGKSLTSLLSGEMRDTAQFGALDSYIVDTIFTKQERALLFRSWGSVASMLLKGGKHIWGNATSSPDEVPFGGYTLMFADERTEEEKENEKELGRKDQKAESSGGVGSERASQLGKRVAEKNNQQVLKHLPNMTADESLSFLFEAANDEALSHYVNKVYSFGVEARHEVLFSEEHRKESRYWSNPLETTLPFAPDMKIFCLYGYGKDTERAYFYKRAEETVKDMEESEREKERNLQELQCMKTKERGLLQRLDDAVMGSELMSQLFWWKAGANSSSEDNTYSSSLPVCSIQDYNTSRSSSPFYSDMTTDSPSTFASDSTHKKQDTRSRKEIKNIVDESTIKYRLDNSISDTSKGLAYGVVNGPGDGTVPLMSLGYMCVEGWTNQQYGFNPSNIPVITREYEHKPLSIVQDVRGGPSTADHVDVLGNHQLIADLLAVASGNEDQVEQVIYSPIERYARRVHLVDDPEDEETKDEVITPSTTSAQNTTKEATTKGKEQAKQQQAKQAQPKQSEKVKKQEGNEEKHNKAAQQENKEAAQKQAEKEQQQGQKQQQHEAGDGEKLKNNETKKDQQTGEQANEQPPTAEAPTK